MLELAVIDEITELKFRTGHLVGEHAWNLFPGGVCVDYNKDTSVMAATTKDLLESGTKIIYEAAFVYKTLIAICDILVVKENGFEVYEVKSSTDLKDIYLQDISFQCYVLSKCGFTVSKASIVHINNQYVRHGELEYDKLFTIIDASDIAIKNQNTIEKKIPEIEAMLSGEMPTIDIGLHCSDPYPCEFSDYCRQHIPGYSVFDLYRIREVEALNFYHKKVVSMRDIYNKGTYLNEIHKLQVEAVINNRSNIDIACIKQFLGQINYPLYFLDFESYQEAVPTFDGCKPYEQIPFQYSLHYMESENGPLQHKEFLGTEGINPKSNLARSLCSDIGKKGTVIAYNIAFEGSILNKLAEEFPKLANHLMAIKNNLYDLIIPFRKGHYYVKEMKGSFSIKSVLPALFPEYEELSYKGLKIQNGSAAMEAFPRLCGLPPDERLTVRNSLLEYCKLDTLAMVKILEKLKAAVE